MIPIDRYAVFGHPINHTKSPLIHRLFAEQTGQKIEYSAYDIPLENFEDAIHSFFSEGGMGLNCTVPLKEMAFLHSNYTSLRAQMSKAVNTLAKQPDGSLFGDNTDGIGLIRDLIDNNGIILRGTRILILGAGGAARGIIGPIIEQQPHKLVVANRTETKAIRLAKEFSSIEQVLGCGFEELHELQFDLIINATSASLRGDLPPLPAGILAAQGSCYDLVYDSEPTAFLLWAKNQRATKALDGLGMLVEQAAEAFFIWRNVRPDTKNIIDLLNAERKSLKPNDQFLYQT